MKVKDFIKCISDLKKMNIEDFDVIFKEGDTIYIVGSVVINFRKKRIEIGAKYADRENIT